VEDEAGTHAPSTNRQVCQAADIVRVAPAVAERQFVNDVAVEQVLDVLRAAAVVAVLMVRILRKGPSRDGLRFGGDVVSELSEESRRIAQAFGERVVHLRLQPIRQAFLDNSLQRIVVANAVGQRQSPLTRQTQQGCIKKRAGRARAIRVQLLLLKHDDVGEVLVVLADVSDLNGGAFPNWR